jgi:REP element-mobilizing transposase RayT
MARRPRLQIPGAAYHVMSRGNRKLPIYEDDHDRRLFQNTVSEAVRRYKIRIFAGCQMGNHYHFVLDCPRNNLSDAMQHINGIYSQDANRRRGRAGHTFEARFHSLVVQRERYLKRSCRYVVRNPIQAGLVEHAADWPWSTYRATAGLEEAPRWLYTDWLLWAFETESMDEAQCRYREYVNNPRIRTVPIDFRAVSLGSKTFKKWVAEMRKAESDRCLPPHPAPTERQPLDTLIANFKCLGTRGELIDEAHAGHGYSLTEIARCLGVDRSRVSRALRNYRRNLNP